MGRIANLIDSREVTARLLANPLGWRVRAVEEIAIDSATSCSRKRSLQVAPLRSLLRDLLPEGKFDCALVAINVAPVPRGPLLDFDVQGPFGPAWLLPRVEIAEREALLLTTLIEAHGIEVSDRVKQLLVGILAFVGDAALNIGAHRSQRVFIEDGLGYQPSRSTMETWESIEHRCTDILRKRADQAGPYSAPESPALLAADLVANGIAADEAGITEVLTEYRDLLVCLEGHSNAEEPTFADDFLNSLADYGYHYDMIVATKVPLDEPFMLKFSERRTVHWSRIGTSAKQDLVVADAVTNHVTFKILDPGARIAEFSARNIGTNSDAFGSFVCREDSQTRSFYAFGDDRDYRVQLRFRLGMLHRLAVVPWFVAAVLSIAVAALWLERPHELSDLTLLVGLSALAVSILYAKEQSTLGSRLRLRSSAAVACSVVVLVVSAVALYAKERDEPRSAVEICQSEKVASRQMGDCHGKEHRSRFSSGISNGPQSN